MQLPHEVGAIRHGCHRVPVRGHGVDYAIADEGAVAWSAGVISAVAYPSVCSNRVVGGQNHLLPHPEICCTQFTVFIEVELLQAQVAEGVKHVVYTEFFVW